MGVENLLDNYRIFETDAFIKNLKKIDNRNRTLIQNKLHSKIYPQLKTEPHYGNNIKKLINYSPETWRYRIGDYRVFYEIKDEIRIINIISVNSRQGAY